MNMSTAEQVRQNKFGKTSSAKKYPPSIGTKDILYRLQFNSDILLHAIRQGQSIFIIHDLDCLIDLFFSYITPI